MTLGLIDVAPAESQLREMQEHVGLVDQVVGLHADLQRFFKLGPSIRQAAPHPEETCSADYKPCLERVDAPPLVELVTLFEHSFCPAEVGDISRPQPAVDEREAGIELIMTVLVGVRSLPRLDGRCDRCSEVTLNR